MITCPHCSSSDIGKWNEALGRYICKRCRKTFTVTDAPNSSISALEQPIEPIVLGEPTILCTRTAGTTVVLADAHLDPDFGYHSAYSVAKAMTFDLKPDRVVFLGDWIDLASLNAWDLNKRQLMEGRRYKKEVDFGLRELEFFRNALPDAEFVFFEGNHEYRLPRYIEQYPEMAGIIDIKTDLRVDELGMTWVPFNDVLKIGKLNYLHGVFYGVYFARATLNAIGESCLFGHSHKSQTWVQRLHKDKMPSIAKGVGCLTELDPVWKRGMPTNFVNSFAVVDYQDNGRFNISEIFCIGGKASYGGRSWSVA